MTINEFIESDESLKNMHYRTVYDTIIVLIGKGILSMDDFK